VSRRMRRRARLLAAIGLVGTAALVVLAVSGRLPGLVESFRRATGLAPDSGVLGVEVRPEEADIKRNGRLRKVKDFADLAAGSKATVLADVEDVTARWNADGTAIETVTRLRVAERLDGDAPSEVTVSQLGGEVGDVGLAVSHVPHWQPSERAVVVLAEKNGRYQVAGGDRGKYRVKGRRVPELEADVDSLTKAAKTGMVPQELMVVTPQESSEAEVAEISADFVLQPYRWTRTPAEITYYVDPTGAPAGVTRDSFKAAVESAFATWARSSNNAIGARFGDQTTGARSANDGRNTIFWAPIDSPGVLGQALCWYSPQTGQALDCDVYFDPGDYPWSTVDQTGLAAIDLESVALHELGHFFGLNHSQDPSAIMFPSLTMGALKRSPAPDDLSGVQSVYGGGVPPSPPPPSRGDQRLYIPSLLRDKQG
jgi:hypothetical protein